MAKPIPKKDLAFILILSTVCGYLAYFLALQYDLGGKTNVYLSQVFRDYSRYKTRQRLFGKGVDRGLIPFLFFDPKHDILLRERHHQDDSRTMTTTELAEFDGRTEDTPIYIAVRGEIYDVSSKRESYGPGKGYNCFVGKDSSLNYATGCTDRFCPGDVNKLDVHEIENLNRWHEFYYNHDKYTFVARLIDDPVEQVLAREFPVDNNEGKADPEEGNNTIQSKEILVDGDITITTDEA